MNWYKKKICNNTVIDSQLKIFLLSFVKNWAIIFFLLMKGFGKLQLIINTSSHFVILEVLILQAPQRWNREASLLFFILCSPFLLSSPHPSYFSKIANSHRMKYSFHCNMKTVSQLFEYLNLYWKFFNFALGDF